MNEFLQWVVLFTLCIICLAQGVLISKLINTIQHIVKCLKLQDEELTEIAERLQEYDN
jgi:hypothetical protein